MGRLVFFLFCLLVALHLGYAAEWGKLKKCSDLGFCRRHRHYTAPVDLVYRVAAKSLKITTWRGQSALTGSISAPSRHPLLFVITAFANGLYRIVIDDEEAVKHERFSVKDVLMPHVQPLSLSDGLLYRDVKYAELLLGGLPVKIYINYDPFRIDAVHAEKGTVIASFNAQSRLLVDAFEEKPPPSPSPSPSPSPVSGTHGEEEENSGASSTSSDSSEASPSSSDASPSSSDASPSSSDASPSSSGAADSEGSGEDKPDHDTHADYEDDFESTERSDTDESENAPEEGGCDGCWEEHFQSHHDPKLRGPESIGVDISFPLASHLYGIPERTSRFSLTNTVGAEKEEWSEPYRMYNLDVFEFELDKPFGLYGSIPFLFARQGKDATGVLWHNSAETFVDVIDSSSEKGKNTHWFSETGMIDVFVLPGPSASHVYEQYLWLTGVPTMPQRFALGYHQCRWNYRDEDDSKAVDAGFDQRDIPYDVLWLDIEHTNGKRYFTWNSERFPDPTGLQNHIAARGRKMVTIIDPHVKRDNKYALHRLAQEQNLYVKKPDGKAFDGWCWPGSSSYFDVTCPRVRDMWAGRFNPTDYPHFTEHLYTWNDMNEPSVFNGPEGTMPKDVIHDGNVEHRHVHNIYGHYFMQATFEGLLKGHGGNDRPFVLSRSFFAGSQRYGAVWTGDNTADWEHLKSSVGMLLTLQISGMTFSGADVGGFFGNPEPELLTRWYQVGAFQPFFRGHAHLDTNRREPWLFGEPFTTHISNAIRMRYTYMPLWYTLFAGSTLGSEAGFVSSSAGPPMRPLWWEFPDDAQSDANERQWMVGDALLVAPVTENGASSHKIYVPPDAVWYDLYEPGAEGRLLAGRGEVELPVTLGRIVVMQRGGTIVPKQERRRRSTVAMGRDPYTLVVALSKNRKARGELYLDDGRSYDHENGSYSLRSFMYDSETLSSKTISGGDKDFHGKDAAVERIVILGYGDREPKRITAAGRAIDFALAKDTGVLTLQRVELPAGVGEWKLTIER